YARLSGASPRPSNALCSLPGGRRSDSTRQWQPDPTARAEVPCMDAEHTLQGIGKRASGTEFSQWDRAWSQTPNSRRHRGTVSTNRHTSSFRRGGFARGDCRRAVVDAGDGRPAIAQVGGGTHHTPASFLRRGDGTPRIKCQGRGNEFDFIGWLVFRTEGFRPQQPRRGGVLSPMLEHERTFFDRFSTLLRSCGRHHIVCRSTYWIFAALDRSRSVP